MKVQNSLILLVLIDCVLYCLLQHIEELNVPLNLLDVALESVDPLKHEPLTLAVEFNLKDLVRLCLTDVTFDRIHKILRLAYPSLLL